MLELPFTPQLCRARTALPEGEEWVYEPKLDGFRALVDVDGDRVAIWSRGGKSLERYFPEVVLPAGRYLLDGELLVPGPDGEPSFDAVSQRIHPAASRVTMLSEQMPATLHVFDLLRREDRALDGEPLDVRRAALAELLAELPDSPILRLVPQVHDVAAAGGWLHEFEGAVAKQRHAPYRPGSRDGMVKVRRQRTLDAVVVGWREGKVAGTVGALILGLHEPDGSIRPVGHVSGLTARQKRELPEQLAPYATGRRGGHEPSRWTGPRDMSWTALRPELVVEVRYEHASDGRLRHGAKLLRWREDKPPRECGVDQLEA